MQPSSITNAILYNVHRVTDPTICCNFYYNDYTVKDGRIEIFYDERYLSLYKPGIKTIV